MRRAPADARRKLGFAVWLRASLQQCLMLAQEDLPVASDRRLRLERVYVRCRIRGDGSPPRDRTRRGCPHAANTQAEIGILVIGRRERLVEAAEPSRSTERRSIRNTPEQ